MDCASICGADDWTKMDLFGQGKQEWLGTFLKLPNGRSSLSSQPDDSAVIAHSAPRQASGFLIRDHHRLPGPSAGAYSYSVPSAGAV